MSALPLRLAVTGASGRMGRKVLEGAFSSKDLSIVAAFSHPLEPCVGRDVGELIGAQPMGVLVQGAMETLSGVDVLIDFSLPDALMTYLPVLIREGIPLVSGTTGLTTANRAELEAASRVIPLLWAPNMSLGANLLIALARQAGAFLGPGYDLEVMEMHHRYKVDAPSGTAVALAAAAGGIEIGDLGERMTLRSPGRIGARRSDEIGIGVLRGGDVVGDHTVYFLGTGERLELTHRALDRGAFATGALRAARFIVGQAPGLYRMADVIGQLFSR